MYSGMTRRMKAHVSTMLSESGLSIASPRRHFKESVQRNARCKTTITAFWVFSVLTAHAVAIGCNERSQTRRAKLVGLNRPRIPGDSIF